MERREFLLDPKQRMALLVRNVAVWQRESGIRGSFWAVGFQRIAPLEVQYLENHWREG